MLFSCLSSLPLRIALNGQVLLSECEGLLSALCCCGTNMPRPLLLLELSESYDMNDRQVIQAIEAGTMTPNLAIVRERCLSP